MAKKATITKVSRSTEWAKKVLGIPQKDLDKYKKEGYPVLYIYEIYPYGGGDDQIITKFFSSAIPDDQLSKYFSNSKIRGQMFGDLIEVIL